MLTTTVRLLALALLAPLLTLWQAPAPAGLPQAQTLNRRVYLPLVLRPEVPSPPEPVWLHTIDNSDNNTFYILQWTAVPRAVDYELQEARDAAFNNPLRVYLGEGLSWLAADKQPGVTYFYRARALNGDGSSRWSRTVQVQVMPNIESGVSILPNHSWILTGSTLQIVGEVYNNTGSWIHLLDIQAVLYRNNQPLQPAYVVGTDLSSIGPYEKGAFLFEGVPAQNANSYELTVDYYENTPDTRPRPTIVDWGYDQSADRSVRIYGVLRNNNNYAINTPSVSATIFNAKGEVIGVDLDLAIHPFLEPGREVLFDFTTGPMKESVGYIRLQTDGVPD